jgi:hypothetical protein
LYFILSYHFTPAPWLCPFFVIFLVLGGLFELWDGLLLFLVAIIPFLWLLLGGHYPLSRSIPNCALGSLGGYLLLIYIFLFSTYL